MIIVTFVEQLIRKKKTGKDFAGIVGVWAGAFLLTVVMVYIGLVYLEQTKTSAFLALAILLSVGAFWLAFRLAGHFTVEYEYSAFEGELTVDRIVAKRKRTRVVQVAAKKIEQLSPIEARAEETGHFDRVLMAAPSEAEATWFVTYSGKRNGRTMVLFAPSEKFFEELYDGQTRAVQTACEEKCRKYGVEIEK